MARVCIDFETASAGPPLKQVGARVYAEHSSTHIICLAYSFNRGNPLLWLPGLPAPEDFFAAIRAGCEVEAHHAVFEKAVWDCLCLPMGWPAIEDHQWRDTMAVAAYHALPLSLEKVLTVIGAPFQKDMEGNKAMRAITSPLSEKSKLFDSNGPPIQWNTDAELRRRVYEYCLKDVKSQDSLSAALGDLPPPEQEVMTLDLKINSRGIKADVEAARGATTILETVKEDLQQQCTEITGGIKASQVQKIREWVNIQTNLNLETLTADDIDEVIPQLSAGSPARRVLELRRRYAAAGGFKAPAIQRTVCSDGRIRNTLCYHGATTGRWAGRLIQPQNFKRPDGQFEEFEEKDWGVLIETLKTGDANLVDCMYGDALDAVANASRAMLIAETDHLFVGGDYAGIEMCVTAALAGEEWKLQAIRDSHAGVGPDLYCVAGSRVFGYEVTSKKTHPKERFVGKTCELAFGYQGAVGAWRKFDRSDQHSNEDIQRYKNAWRAEHPGLTGYGRRPGEDPGLWRGLNEAAIACVQRKVITGYGWITFELRGPWLTVQLPSGRLLWYFDPKVEWVPSPWDPEKRIPQVSVMQVREGQWKRQKMFGGRWTENIVQAISRDILVRALFRLETENYPVVLTVHDEALCEVQERLNPDPQILKQIMEDVAEWAKAMKIPILVESWMGRRFRK